MNVLLGKRAPVSVRIARRLAGSTRTANVVVPVRVDDFTEMMMTGGREPKEARRALLLQT